MKDTKKITVNGEKVEIKKMPIRRFAELMMAVEHLPSKLQGAFSAEELENLDNQAFLMKIPALLGDSQDEIFNLVAIASGVEKETMLDYGLDEFLDVISAVLELNNIQAIVSKVKNMGNLLQTKAKK
jgi:hypothetical protein